MTDAPLLDEEARLSALHRYDVLDSAPEAQFDKIVDLVRTVFRVPIATVTLVAQDRQWFKARLGLAASETPRGVSFCTHTIQQREALVVPDAHADPRFASSPLVVGDPFVRSYAGVPLRTPDGYNVGALCAMDTQPRDFSPAEIAILANFASLVVDEFELRQIARRDQLTGALTRRGFVEQAAKEIARHQRYGRPGSLLMLDVDHFKSVNDTYGHPAGDQVLRLLADLCGEAMRPNDVLGRIGGEEFALLLPETDAAEALVAADRFRALIAARPFTLADGTALPITASFGVAELNRDIDGVDSWLAAADAPLYAAKRGGRNRCCLAELPKYIAA
ncbi:MAG TPA: sensor domain-containing diguanylate cyclase [Sphingomonas sp.]|jgi:diguanylate cyclase (GGDEF)-like protein|uniref:sensor domain-containing diguanylate cyclase n=1 Tax=Sphingomonas sp. TaxID=28214 RepID=UPI002EDAD6CE